MKRMFFLLILSFYTLSCTSTVNKDFDSDLLPVFKKFQKIIEMNPDKLRSKHYNNIAEKVEYTEIADGFRWIVESNFNRLFKFLNDKDREEIHDILKTKRVVRIEVKDQNCILFKIRPDFENNLWLSDWEELYIGYYNNCDCVCHKRINQTDIPQDKITTIENNWFKVIAKNRRYIGG